MRLAGTLAARAIDAVRIHRLTFGSVEGIPGVFKKRRPGMEPVIWCGNWFLRWSKSGIRMFPSTRQWQRFEARAFALCHPGRLVKAIGSNTLFFERLPGRSLRDLALGSGLPEGALASAAVELRRVHALVDPATGAPWSHGDPHLANFLFDATEERCRLIDFETVHLESEPAAWRHSDDLLVFCLELIGRGKAADSVALAAHFVRAYDRPEVTEHLVSRLDLPRGFELILWQTRTEYLAASELRLRLQAFRGELS